MHTKSKERPRDEAKTGHKYRIKKELLVCNGHNKIEKDREERKTDEK